jgi:hypothetical protein
MAMVRIMIPIVVIAMTIVMTMMAMVAMRQMMSHSFRGRW